jgi:hypothetical protein
VRADPGACGDLGDPQTIGRKNSSFAHAPTRYALERALSQVRQRTIENVAVTVRLRRPSIVAAACTR